MKKIGPTITDTAAEFYPAEFGTLNAGATFVLEALPGLYRHSLKQWLTIGMFDNEHLKEIVLAVKDQNLASAPGLAGQLLTTVLHNAMSGGKKNLQEIIDKLNHMPRFDRACMEIWASAYWLKPAKGRPSVEKYIVQV